MEIVPDQNSAIANAKVLSIFPRRATPSVPVKYPPCRAKIKNPKSEIVLFVWCIRSGRDGPNTA